jgi:hypothetical protein
MANEQWDFPHDFDPQVYLELNADLKAAGVNPIDHYNFVGRFEGRRYRANTVFVQWHGFCPICRAPTQFIAYDVWLRDHLLCRNCEKGSIPRDRAIMTVVDDVLPGWRNASIHESSPNPYGASAVFAKECQGYTPSQFFKDAPLGDFVSGVRCENLENQTFPDASFDLVITMDVMEHVFHPDEAHREIWRTLKPHGFHIHTTPIYPDVATTKIVATIADDGKVTHLETPEYHGNPVDNKGALVTVRYGQDIGELISKWAPFDVEIRRFNDKTHGIVGGFTDVIICRKRSLIE